jgi:hypothetical protein
VNCFVLLLSITYVCICRTDDGDGFGDSAPKLIQQQASAPELEAASKRKEAWEAYLLMKQQERQKPVVDILASSLHESLHECHISASPVHSSSEAHPSPGNSANLTRSWFSPADSSAKKSCRELEQSVHVAHEREASARKSYRESAHEREPSVRKSFRESAHAVPGSDRETSARKSFREPVVDADHMISYKNRNPHESLTNNSSYRGSFRGVLSGSFKLDSGDASADSSVPLAVASPLSIKDVYALPLEGVSTTMNVEMVSPQERGRSDSLVVGEPAMSASERLADMIGIGRKKSTIVPVNDTF